MTADGESKFASPDIWKFLTTFLAGVVLTLIAAYFTNQKNVVTKEDLALFLNAQQRQLDDQGRDIAQLKATALQLELNTARIAEHLDVQSDSKSLDNNRRRE